MEAVTIKQDFTNGDSSNHTSNSGPSDHQSSEIDCSTDSPKSTLESEEELGGPKFDPPLYKQRYEEVSRILDMEKVVRVADFGCAEGKILSYLKRLQHLEEIYAVDLDANTMARAKYIIEPLLTDYLNPRHIPLTMRLWQGDVTKFDARFKDLDAITLVEVIEHLEADILAALPENLFQRLRPRLIILTTPNAEFNVLFPGFSGFRHWDHKFEWTRAEFEAWCTEQARTYNYDVSFSGVGTPPPDRVDVGNCSQTALFRRKDRCENTVTTGEHGGEKEEPYVLLDESIHPFKPAPTLEEEILTEAPYYIHQRAMELQTEYFDDSDYETEATDGEHEDIDGEKYIMNDDVAYVSIEKLSQCSRLADMCDLEKLRSVLVSSADFEFSKNKEYVRYQFDQSPDLLASTSSSTPAGGSDINGEATSAVFGERWCDLMDDDDDDLGSPSDQPWNNPENWALPLEVTNPELMDNMKTRGDGYLQGFHKGCGKKKTISQRFLEAHEKCLYATIVHDQFADAVVSQQGEQQQQQQPQQQQLNGYNIIMGGNEREEILQDKLARMRLQDSNPVVDTAACGSTSDTVESCQSTAASSTDDSSSLRDQSDEFFFVPGLERVGVIHAHSWNKPACAIESDQFESD